MPTPREAHEVLETADKALRQAQADMQAEDTPARRSACDKALDAWDDARKNYERAKRLAEYNGEERDEDAHNDRDDVLRKAPIRRGSKLDVKERERYTRHAFDAVLRAAVGFKERDFRPQSKKALDVLKIDPFEATRDGGLELEGRFNPEQYYDDPERALEDHHTRDAGDMSLGVATTAPEFVPEGFFRRIFEHQRDISAALNFCQVTRTESLGDLPVPCEDDTDNELVLEAENGTTLFYKPDLDIRTLQGSKGATAARISRAAAQDWAFDFVGWAASRMGRRSGKGINNLITNGDGTTGAGMAQQPWGYVTRAAAMTNGPIDYTADFDYANSLDVAHGLIPSYRNDPSFMLSMHDSVVKILRQIVGTVGQPLWSVSMRDGIPGALHGQDYFVNQDMDASHGIGDHAIATGAMNYFLVRFKGPDYFAVARERYIENDWIAVFFRTIFDSDIMAEDDWADPPIRVTERSA